MGPPMRKHVCDLAPFHPNCEGENPGDDQGPSTHLTRRLAARWLFRVTPCRKGTLPLTNIHELSRIRMPRSSIHHEVKKYKEQKSVDNKPRSGRPRKFSEVVERWLVREIKKERKTNASNLAKVTKDYLNIDVTPQIVRNYLHNNGFNARTARKKPYTYI
ncbi:hypothetical protein TNCV_929391 [Trichonephila clavipes]|nr:hypothetical protein TNCV_929391 [Trichonephila clavipes]